MLSGLFSRAKAGLKRAGEKTIDLVNEEFGAIYDAKWLRNGMDKLTNFMDKPATEPVAFTTLAAVGLAGFFSGMPADMENTDSVSPDSVPVLADLDTQDSYSIITEIKTRYNDEVIAAIVLETQPEVPATVWESFKGDSLHSNDFVLDVYQSSQTGEASQAAVIFNRISTDKTWLFSIGGLTDAMSDISGWTNHGYDKELEIAYNNHCENIAQWINCVESELGEAAADRLESQIAEMQLNSSERDQLVQMAQGSQMMV